MIELPEGFPDLLGCSRHRPIALELRRWYEPLGDEHRNRVTIASGLSWTVALDRASDGVWTVIVDCTWAANGLRDLGIDVAAAPLVAIQTWGSRERLDDINGCRACEERLARLDRVLVDHWSEGLVDADEIGLPRFPRLKWTDSPDEIAAIIATDLRARSIVGEAMTVLEGTAGWDLVPKAPIYVQLRLGLEGELQIEARKDFSYWNVVVDEARANVFAAAGFSLHGPHGFEMLLGPDPHDLSHRDAIAAAIRSAVEVFEPRRRRIRVERFTGASHIEGPVSERDHAVGQRRIDRTGWPDLLEAADRRLEDMGDGDRLFDVLEDRFPDFAELVALAHLDEYFDRMDDLRVLVPADLDDIVNGVESDLLTCEDLVEFVLRHCYRWSEQRARDVAGDDATVDPEELTIETIGHEHFPARLRDGELTEIGGLRIGTAPDDSCVNGSFAVLHGRLEPPAPPPPFVIPEFD